MHTSTMKNVNLTGPTLRAAVAQPTVACFGRYEVLAALGEGGAGRVFVGQVRGPTVARRLVAIKHLTSEETHEELWRVAVHEARLGARIRHANVIGVVDVDDGGIGPYIVMEYVEGGALMDLLSRSFERSQGKQGLPVGIAVRIALDALFGLHAAHELRDEHGRSLSLVHRDVTPHNIIVGVDGVARVSDFGIARLRHAIHTAPGLVRGKAGYLAPEQALGQTLDRRTDVFAMGIVLWESLTGNRLFDEKTTRGAFIAALEQPIPAPSQLAPVVTPALDHVCLRALERDPRKRWPTARAFADALAAAARESGPAFLATQGEIADHVETTLVDLLEQRRSVIRLSEAMDLGPKDVPPESTTLPLTRRRPVLLERPMPEQRQPETVIVPASPRPSSVETFRTPRRGLGRARLAMTLLVAMAGGLLGAAAVVAVALRLWGVARW